MVETDNLRSYAPERCTPTVSAKVASPTQRFRILRQIALLTQNDLLESTHDLARLRTCEVQIAKIGLAQDFAGAALLPCRDVLDAACESRHDLEALVGRFGGLVEQVAHRLSPLQRPGAQHPFFFVRVDQAGTVTKRHSATRFPFACYGGACPLWNVHQAFETPVRVLRQPAETPDGVRCLCLAR